MLRIFKFGIWAHCNEYLNNSPRVLIHPKNSLILGLDILQKGRKYLRASLNYGLHLQPGGLNALLINK